MKRLILAATIAASLSASIAQAGTVNLPATKSIWLAGQSAGASTTGYFGSDTAPGNAPLEFLVTSPTQTFSATGSTSVDDSNYGGPDGAPAYPNESGFSPSPWDGDYAGAASALVGIYLDGTAPSLINSGGFVGPDGWSQATSNTAPGLNQIFIIGDGSGGAITAPTGATELFIATADSLGASTGNAGSLTVTFSGASLANVPEPTTWGLMIVGLGLLGVAMRRRKAGAALAA